MQNTGRLFKKLTLVFALGAMLGTIADASERRILRQENADYSGHDLQTLKEVTLEDCEKACIGDTACEAFTYNTKARWCFLKSDYGALRPFVGAVAGRIVVEEAISSEDLLALRKSELKFLPYYELDGLVELENEIARRPVEVSLKQALAELAQKTLGNDFVGANESYKNALHLAPERFDLWEGFTRVAMQAAPTDGSLRYRLRREGRYGAIATYLRAKSDEERVRALGLMITAYKNEGIWRPAIKAARMSLSLKDDPSVAAELEEFVTQHGFRVTSDTIDTREADPAICMRFSEEVASDLPNLSDFVSVAESGSYAIEASGDQICIRGVNYGERYRVTVRQGLPAADPEEILAKSVTIEAYVRDRDAQVRFLSQAYVLPRHKDATIPIETINVDIISAEVLRIGDRGLAPWLRSEQFLSQISLWDAQDIENVQGESIWKGTIKVERALNQGVTNAIPVGDIVTTLEPGVYALVARDQNTRNNWDTQATQWFVVSDMGLSTLSGEDGLHAVLRSLNTAAPIPGAKLQLLAQNNEVLGEAVSNAEGYARFDPGLLRGTGGNLPALLIAEGKEGDFTFIDLTRPAFDLADRGVEGRTPPAPVDVFITAERGVYRPGETAHLTILARDAAAKAIPDLPLTLLVKRPDGLEYTRMLTEDAGAGGRSSNLPLPDNAMRGQWRAEVYTDPKGNALASTEFLVEDFVPERLDFSFELPEDRPLQSGETDTVSITANWLYGAPAVGLPIEGEVYVTKATHLPFAPTFRFGLEDDEFRPIAESVSADPTHEDGTAEVTLLVPDVSDTTLPLQAAVHIRVIDTNGRPVERRQQVAVTNGRSRIGIDPQFDGTVGEKENARFSIAVFDGVKGERLAAQDLRWTLSRIETRWQWYRGSGYWDYEPIQTIKSVANGSIDLAAGEVRTLDLPVEWGKYQLKVEDPLGEVIPVSFTFHAGWYVAPSADPAPDLLKVTLDKEKYKVGDMLTARIHPRFPGIAVVSVLDNRLIAMKTVEVGEEGATVDFTVTEAWGPGAYVTATLIRPMDVPAKRMPQRALGLAWASIDPGDRLLDVSVNVPETQQPRTALPVEVALNNAAPGDEAYVTIAAVDLGVLNLTEFDPPAPEDWYFAKRRLGVEIRDIYGRLIDTMLGVKADVRSGGDGGGLARLAGPPPAEKIVAFYQGVTRIGEDGKAHASFDVPDFNGTLRVMAIAWSKNGVGHGFADVMVRDPVVVQAALPNFLAPGDQSRLRLDLTHTEGPAGEVRLDVTTAASLVTVENNSQAITLPEKGSAVLEMPLVANRVGDETLTITLTLSNGQQLIKTLALGVRANEPSVSRTSEIMLVADKGSLTLDSDIFADFIPGTASATLMVGGVRGIDLPGLVQSLDRYPYGCSEQITSRALPLVYLDDVVLAAGLSGEASVRDRVNKAIADVLLNQASNGSFGLWGPEGSDSYGLWLDAYITDFLTRAKEKNFEVPSLALDLAVTNLKNKLAYMDEESKAQEGLAYVLYVLARNGRASIGDLRYYSETKLEMFRTPLAKAQLAAALALYGDKPRADALFTKALETLNKRFDPWGWRYDYGTHIRDSAALVTLASEVHSGSIDLTLLTRELKRTEPTTAYHRNSYSTQEQAWMLLAAHSLLTEGLKPVLDIDGARHEGIFSARYTLDDLDKKITINNLAPYETEARFTVSGVPLTPEPAGGKGYSLSRRYFDLEGNELEPENITLGQRLFIILTVQTEGYSGKIVVDDPLPAGLVIDNPNLLKGAEARVLDWIVLSENAEHTEFRSDRFIASVHVSNSIENIALGYMARAVAPGSYARPAAIVEDMYRPYLNARTESGRLVVNAAP